MNSRLALAVFVSAVVLGGAFGAAVTPWPKRDPIPDVVAPHALPDPLVSSLESLPVLAEVRTSGASDAPRRIVHLCDWHSVARDDFAAAQRAAEPNLTDAEIDERFATLERQVADVQDELEAVLRALIRDQGLRFVYLEGISAESLAEHQRLIDELRGFEIGPERRRVFGAVARLLIAGEPIEVRPLEDAAAYAAANPIGPDGKLAVDPAARRAREDAIVRNLERAGEPLVVCVLGGGHDLAEAIDRVGLADAAYLRVTTRSYRLADQ